jgi:hypothetical protein
VNYLLTYKVIIYGIEKALVGKKEKEYIVGMKNIDLRMESDVK